MIRYRLLPLVLLAAFAADAQPELRLSPDTLDFGEVPVGAVVSGEFVLIESVGDESILIKIHAAFQPFAMPFDQRYRLDPVEDGLIDSRAAVLALAPVRTGPLASDVAVDTDERGAYVVQARAVGTDPVSFSLAHGETASRTLEIRNPGFAPLTVRTGAQANWLGITPATFTLEPHETREVTVDVDASGLAPGIYRDTLQATNQGTLYDYDWHVPTTLTVTGATNDSREPVAAQPILRVSPTPARGPVRIEYTLERPADLSLRVYDASGREVARLAEGVRQRGEVTWSAPSPGLYVVRLVTSDGTASATAWMVR